MRIKSTLMRVGSVLGNPFVRSVERAADCLVMGQWMARHGLRPTACPTRESVWRVLADTIGERPVLYLEFGVFQGEATRWWASHLNHPDSVLHGFDSFEGLPEDWRSDRPKGMFNTNGRVPKIDDRRVQFFKGWFSDILPRYALPPHDLLLINIDVDLYLSTKYVLDFLGPHMQVGTLLYFDEFSSRQHEFRAFDEFLAATGVKIRLVASDPVLYAVAFEVTSAPTKPAE